VKALGEVGPAKGLTVEGRADRDIVVDCNESVQFNAPTRKSGTTQHQQKSEVSDETAE
jgi:hypothetical protein